MMLAIEERLFDEYKMVDNICRDMFSSQSGIKQYIMEMEQQHFYGRSVVQSWDEDYRRLKRVQWLRNKIAHESGVTECNENDAAWLENFHRRLLARQDPLALLSYANQKHMNYPMQQESKPKYNVIRNARLRKKKASPLKRAITVIIVLIEVLVILYIVALLLNTAMTMK